MKDTVLSESKKRIVGWCETICGNLRLSLSELQTETLVRAPGIPVTEELSDGSKA